MSQARDEDRLCWVRCTPEALLGLRPGDVCIENDLPEGLEFVKVGVSSDERTIVLLFASAGFRKPEDWERGSSPEWEGTGPVFQELSGSKALDGVPAKTGK